jgi:hypothetical protein
MTEGTRDTPRPEQATQRPPRKRPKKPGPLPTVLAALAVFAVAFEFLAFQLSAGKDPALGPAVAATPPASKARPAKKLVITKVIPAGNGSVGASSYSSSGSAAAPAPVVTSSS